MTKQQARIRALGHAADLIRDGAAQGHESLFTVDGIVSPDEPPLPKADAGRVHDACEWVADLLERRLFRLQAADEKRTARRGGRS